MFKHLLPRTASRAAGATGRHGWLPLTFDCSRELLALAGAHEAAQAAGEAPLWIVKPWNMGRSLDTAVTGSLPAVAAAARAGPKVAQEYIRAPMLFRGRKFDLRVLVAVRAFAPALEAAAWAEVFVRAANKPYGLSPAALCDFQCVPLSRPRARRRPLRFLTLAPPDSRAQDQLHLHAPARLRGGGRVGG